jgi:hypothetical protein
MKTKLTNISKRPLQVRIQFMDHDQLGNPIPQDDVIDLASGGVFWANAELNYIVDISRARDLRCDTYR